MCPGIYVFLLVPSIPANNPFSDRKNDDIASKSGPIIASMSMILAT